MPISFIVDALQNTPVRRVWFFNIIIFHQEELYPVSKN